MRIPATSLDNEPFRHAMEIRATTLPGMLQTPRPAAEVLLRAGQVVSGRVLVVEQQSLVLEVAGQRLSAQAPEPLQPGQWLHFRVLRGGETPVLRVLEDPGAQLQALTLRSALPRQAGMAPLLANLHALARGDAPGLPRGLAEQAAAILARLPTPQQVTEARGLRQALQDAGPLLEARLAAAIGGAGIAELATWLRRDLKAALLGLRQALAASPSAQSGQGAPNAAGGTHQPSPPPPLPGQALQAQAAATPTLRPGLPASTAQAQLLGQVEGALARIQVHQQVSLTAQEQGPALVLELPLRQAQHADLWHLRLEQDGPAPRPGQPAPWSATLAFDLPGLGAVEARVTVRGEHVGVGFWTAEQATAELFQAHLDHLRQDLEREGLVPGHLRCQRGRAPAPSREASGTGARGMLDTRA